MISKANLKLIEGDLEIQEKKPDEFGLYGEAACIGALAPCQSRPGYSSLENQLPKKSFFLFGPRQVGKSTLLKVVRIEPTLLCGIPKAVRDRPCPRRGLAPCLFFCSLLRSS